MVKKISTVASSNYYNCEHCKKIFKSKGSLRYHVLSQHTPGACLYSCNVDECRRLFRNPKRLSEHKRRYHLNREEYVCEFCGYQTRIRSNLTVHRRQHTGDKPYCCEYCALRFPSSYQLAIHKDDVHTNRSYVCLICGESFSNKKTLSHHKDLHASEKKYRCQICNKTYQQSAGLSRHKSWHRKQLIVFKQIKKE